MTHGIPPGLNARGFDSSLRRHPNGPLCHQIPNTYMAIQHTIFYINMPHTTQQYNSTATVILLYSPTVPLLTLHYITTVPLQHRYAVTHCYTLLHTVTHSYTVTHYCYSGSPNGYFQ